MTGEDIIGTYRFRTSSDNPWQKWSIVWGFSHVLINHMRDNFLAYFQTGQMRAWVALKKL